MSRILALAYELEAIKKRSKKRLASSSQQSRAFSNPLRYDFDAAYHAAHRFDGLARQHSLSSDWSKSFSGELVFQELVTTNRDAFVQRVREISTQLQINPNWLMAVMRFESRLNHQAVNSVSGATGLIQFMPNTARSLGTTTQALAQMTNVQQLEYVLRYYNSRRGRMHNYLDCYLVTFYPYAMGRPDTFVLGSENSPERAALVAHQNTGLDTNHDGQITVAEVRQRIYRGLTQDQINLIDGTSLDRIAEGVGSAIADGVTNVISPGNSNSNVGGQIGTVIGQAIGGAAGPFGAVAGAIAGNAAGNAIGNMISGSQSYNGNYASAFDTPEQIVAREIVQDIGTYAPTGRITFMNDVRQQLEQFANTGTVRGRSLNLALLQSLKSLMTGSLQAVPTGAAMGMMSLVRFDGHSPHYRGVAIDLVRIGGYAIDIFNQQQTLQAVLFAINNLAPGRYVLGLPRPPYNDGRDVRNPAISSSLQNRIRGLFTWNGDTATPTQAYNNLLNSNNFVSYRWNEHFVPGPINQALQEVSNPSARQQLQSAIANAAQRGVIITHIMADGLDHLHIQVDTQ